MFKVTIEFLRSWYACDDPRRVFLARYPDGVELADLLSDVCVDYPGETMWLVDTIIRHGLLPLQVVVAALTRVLAGGLDVPGSVIDRLANRGVPPQVRLRRLRNNTEGSALLLALLDDLLDVGGVAEVNSLAFNLRPILGLPLYEANTKLALALVVELRLLEDELPSGPGGRDDSYGENEGEYDEDEEEELP